MTFWGSPKRLGLLPYFITIAQNSTPFHGQATLGQSETGHPGVAEALVSSGASQSWGAAPSRSWRVARGLAVRHQVTVVRVKGVPVEPMP